jgi:hypothetical protein
MGNIGTLFILGTIVAALAVGTLVVLIFLALLSYVVKSIYPPVRRVALWAARLDNFLPLLIFYVVLIFLIILILVFALKLPSIAKVILILLVLVLLVVLVCVGTLLGLAILVYIVRAVRWLYGRWKGLLGRLLPQIMKLKLKHEVGKDKDKDWTTHFAEMRKKLSDEAERARRRISKGDK